MAWDRLAPEKTECLAVFPCYTNTRRLQKAVNNNGKRIFIRVMGKKVYSS